MLPDGSTCQWNVSPSDCEWSGSGACVATSAFLAETASMVAAIDIMSGAGATDCSTPGAGDCTCTSGDLAAMATMDQDNPDIAGGCMSCMISASMAPGAGEDASAACMAGAACTPGAADCVCTFAELMAAGAAGDSDQAPAVSSGCMSCMMGGEDNMDACMGMAGCTAGSTDPSCTCSVADLDLVMAAEGDSDQEPDMAQMSAGCIGCIMANDGLAGEDASAACMAGAACTPGAADCVCTFAELMAAGAAGDSDQAPAVSSGCMSCMMGGEDNMDACMGMAGCTAGSTDPSCTCSVADLDLVMAAEGDSDQEPDMAQMSAGCIGCIMANDGLDGGDEIIAACFGMGAGAPPCSPGTAGCVCSAPDYTAFEGMAILSSAAAMAGDAPPDDSGPPPFGGACLRCMSATGIMDDDSDTSGGGGGDNGADITLIDTSVAGLTSLCPVEVAACLADSACAAMLPVLGYQANDDMMGAITATCPTEAAACDDTCTNELTTIVAAMSADDGGDGDGDGGGGGAPAGPNLAGMSDGTLAVFACVVTSGMVR